MGFNICLILFSSSKIEHVMEAPDVMLCGSPQSQVHVKWHFSALIDQETKNLVLSKLNGVGYKTDHAEE